MHSTLRKQPHFAKGIAPAEIIMAAMNRYGYIDNA